ncbi:MAG: hypothetical protein EBT89_00570 [Opitutaceae bacterium]|nr:hypothetical protein [Opitutaceae bacterium]
MGQGAAILYALARYASSCAASLVIAAAAGWRDRGQTLATAPQQLRLVNGNRWRLESGRNELCDPLCCMLAIRNCTS